MLDPTEEQLNELINKQLYDLSKNMTHEEYLIKLNEDFRNEHGIDYFLINGEKLVDIIRIHQELIEKALSNRVTDIIQIVDLNQIQQEINAENINYVDQNQLTPLFYAAWEGNKEMVKFLLENGAKVDKETKEGYTALTIAT